MKIEINFFFFKKNILYIVNVMHAEKTIWIVFVKFFHFLVIAIVVQRVVGRQLRHKRTGTPAEQGQVAGSNTCK